MLAGSIFVVTSAGTATASDAAEPAPGTLLVASETDGLIAPPAPVVDPFASEPATSAVEFDSSVVAFEVTEFDPVPTDFKARAEAAASDAEAVLADHTD